VKLSLQLHESRRGIKVTEKKWRGMEGLVSSFFLFISLHLLEGSIKTTARYISEKTRKQPRGFHCSNGNADNERAFHFFPAPSQSSTVGAEALPNNIN
jgi:hypothetical protein